MTTAIVWTDIVTGAAKIIQELETGKTSDPIVSLPTGSITVGQAKTVINDLVGGQLKDFAIVWQEKLSNVNDDATALTDVMGDLAPLIPDEAVIAAAIKLLAFLYSTGAIKGAEPGGGVGGSNFDNHIDTR